MTVGVWGYGREGRAAVDWLRPPRPSRSWCFDDRAAAFGADSERVHFTSDFAALTAVTRCLVSPGVPHTDLRRADLIKSGVVIETGTQLWMRTHHARTIGVTGTKGKSTTASLIHHLLSGTGVPNELAGNIGVPLLDVPEAGQYVVELSSYQCESARPIPGGRRDHPTRVGPRAGARLGRGLLAGEGEDLHRAWAGARLRAEHP